MSVQWIIDDIVSRVKPIDGVVGIVLGGSRAKGTHTPKSDIDIGIYYESETAFDIPSLQKAAAAIDATHREQLLTGIGEWGSWINGGGWLTVEHFPVDFLYRDLNKVTQTIEKCSAGEVTIDYYPGHPHGFINAIYMAEIAWCNILWDPSGAISALKERTVPYPAALKQAIITKFLWEASFSLNFAKKSAIRRDASHAAGCCFRAVSCLNQALFARNEVYWMNETGAVDIADSFPIAPKHYKDRINEVFSLISSDSEDITQAINLLRGIIQEVEGIY